MKLTFQIQLFADPDSPPLQGKLVMAGRHGEMTWHLALKLLAYVLFYEQRLVVEEGIGWHYKPDLVSVDDQNRVRIWIDCGNIAVRKVDRVATKIGTTGQFYIFKRHVAETRIFLRTLEKKVKHRRRLTVIAFDDGFVDQLAELLDGTNRLTAHRGRDHLSLTLQNRHGSHELCSKLHRF